MNTPEKNQKPEVEQEINVEQMFEKASPISNKEESKNILSEIMKEDNESEDSKDERAEKQEDEELDLDDSDGQIEETDVEDEEMESSFINLAEDLGIGKIEKDDYETFKTTYQSSIEKIKAEAKAEGKKEGQQINLEKYGPEAKYFIEALESGMTYEQFINPAKEANDLIALSDEELAKQQFKADGYPDEKAEKKVAQLIEDDELEIFAWKIRKSLYSYIDNKRSEIINNLKNAKESATNEKLALNKQENEAIVSKIKTIKDYQGRPIKKEAINKLVEKWESGFYKKEFAKNPDFVVQAILGLEFAKKAIKESADDAAKKAAEKEKEKIRKKMHNIDDAGEHGSVQKSKKGQTDAEIMEELMNSGDSFSIQY